MESTITPLPEAKAAVDHLNTLFSNFEQNRKTIQDKWDRNHRAFVRQEPDEQWKTGEGEDWRSTTYLAKTREKVMAAAALVMDTTLQGGKIPYAFKPSPWQPEIGDVTLDADAAMQAAISDMTGLVDQQLVDTHADRQLMKHVISQSLYGLTFGKRIVHAVKRGGWRRETMHVDGIEDYSRMPTAQTWVKWSVAQMQPGWVYVPCWDIFWDIESESLQDGAGVFHRQIVSPYWLRSKIGKPFFFDNALLAAAKQSPSQAQSGGANVGGTTDLTTLAPILRDVKMRKNILTYREFWGRIPRKLAEQIEASLEIMGYNGEAALDGYDESGDEVEVMVCTCGDYLVRYCRNEPDNRPFSMAKCEDNLDEETPWGIADNCEPLQMVINGGIRAFEDNKKLSANVILAVKRRLIKNMPEKFKPGTKLELAEECDDARKAIQPVVIPDVGETLLSLLQTALPMLDDASMVPRIAQGYVEKDSQTATEISVRQAQASKYMGMLIRNLDEGIIEPMIEYLYQYNMNDPEVAVGKGNFIVQALGFSAYQNKIERTRKIQELMMLALNVAPITARVRFDYLFRELVKATDLDPDFVLMNEQEAPPPPEPDPMQKAGMEAEIRKAQAEATEQETQAQLNVAKAELTQEQAEHVGEEVRNVDREGGVLR